MVKLATIDHNDNAIRTFMLFTQLAGATVKYIDSRYYRELRLSMIKYIVLRVLVTNGGTLKHSDIAKWTNTKKHNITTLVDRMKEDQLVTTARGQKDRRVNNVTITDKGRDVLQKANPIGRKMVQSLMKGIDDKNMVEFERLLNIIRANIERD